MIHRRLRSNSSTQEDVGPTNETARPKPGSGRSLQSLQRLTTSRLLRAASQQYLKRTSPLYSFKSPAVELLPGHPNCRPVLSTFPAASREVVRRLYMGPSKSAAGAWDAVYDSPGPQAYGEVDQWQRVRSKAGPCVLFGMAKSPNVTVTPGPGDYEVARSSFTAGPMAQQRRGKRWAARSPEQPKGEVPCSYQENFSSIQQQVISGKKTAPSFSFATVPRFKQLPGENDSNASSSKTGFGGNPSTQKQEVLETKKGRQGQGNRGRRGGRRRRRRGCYSIIKHEDYSWLHDCCTPGEWVPSLKLTSNFSGNPPRPDGSMKTPLGGSPVPVMRQGPRYNTAQHDPLVRDLPRANDSYPGPKYLPSCDLVLPRAPTPKVCVTERFPKEQLFAEEEVVLREATPGPETYNVALSQRLECLALERLALGAADPSGFSDSLGMEGDDSQSSSGSSSISSNSNLGTGKEKEACTRECSAHIRPHYLGWEEAGLPNGTFRQPNTTPCPACEAAGPQLAATPWSTAAAAATLLDGNTFRQAHSLGASVVYGDMPRQRTAPSYSMGAEQRDVAPRHLHVPQEAIYREERLGRSGPGPVTARPGIDRTVCPRALEAKIVLPPVDSKGAKSFVPKEAGSGLGLGDSLGPQVSSKHASSPAYSIPMALRSCDLFHDWRLHKGKEVSRSTDGVAVAQPYFDSHIPTSEATSKAAHHAQPSYCGCEASAGPDAATIKDPDSPP